MICQFLLHHTHISFTDTYNSIYSMYNAVTCTSGLSECHMHMYSPFHSFNISSSAKAGSGGEGEQGRGEMERGNRGEVSPIILFTQPIIL